LLPLSLQASLLAVLLASKFHPASQLADNKAVASYRTPNPVLAGGALRCLGDDDACCAGPCDLRCFNKAPTTRVRATVRVLSKVL
jgi:hypothetical protein